MKKKIGFGIIAASIIASAFVFAGSSKTDNNCPDRPDCICSKKTNEQVVSNHPQTIADKKTNCPNTPDCICKK